MRVLLGDCVARMAEMPDASVVSVVCDPPYGLEFLGKDWDSFKTGRSAAYAAGGELNTKNMQARSGKGGAGPAYVKRAAKRCSTCGKQQWSGSPCKCVDPEWEIDNSPLLAFQSWASVWLAEVFRVLRPGGQVKAFGGTRVFHRLGAAMESVGFTDVGVEAWDYASGFPKSLSVEKALDKMRGTRTEVDVVRSWIVQQRDAAGLTDRLVDERLGHKTRGALSNHWTTHPTQPSLPTAEEWPSLLEVLGNPVVPEEVALLVGRLVRPAYAPGVSWDQRVVVGTRSVPTGHAFAGHTYQDDPSQSVVPVSLPATSAARIWAGWGTALKPAWEPVLVGTKPT